VIVVEGGPIHFIKGRRGTGGYDVFNVKGGGHKPLGETLKSSVGAIYEGKGARGIVMSLKKKVHRQTGSLMDQEAKALQCGGTMTSGGARQTSPRNRQE